MGAIIGWVLSKVLPGVLGNIATDILQDVFGIIGKELDRRAAIEDGHVQQAAAESANSAKVASAEAQAAADAPHTEPAVVDALRKGAF